ncbi:hypothetical protein [Legionella septentrionalis]|uniref:Uncharacterized protein n=1 Tax=Legionella septentrionalis TaxID=2498109 RepID=A0A433JMJ1_9GAMM|nr:hypothetical protein [Legionella septentrionalis]RUQ91547.1 hypothetical protein EKM59_00360 [Legionella septentrionalis]
MANKHQGEQEPHTNIAVGFNGIFSKFKKKIEDTTGVHAPQDDKEWHQAFIEYFIAKRFDTPLQKLSDYFQSLDGRTTLDSFVRMLKGIYATGMGVTAPPPAISMLSKDEAQDKEAARQLIDYSIALEKGGERSNMYRARFEEFKNNYATAQKHDLENAAARDTLQEIKGLIETTDWKVGLLGSRTKISVDGETKPVPKHIHEIYTKVEEALKLNKPDVAMETLKNIHEIADRAKNFKQNFASLRKRDESTQEAYEEIEKQTRNFSPK